MKPNYQILWMPGSANQKLKNKLNYFSQGGFYWVLGNLHPKYRLSLKILNLAILCPVKWIKKYGMQQVLKPLMADVALLESVSR